MWERTKQIQTGPNKQGVFKIQSNTCVANVKIHEISHFHKSQKRCIADTMEALMMHYIAKLVLIIFPDLWGTMWGDSVLYSILSYPKSFTLALLVASM